MRNLVRVAGCLSLLAVGAIAPACGGGGGGGEDPCTLPGVLAAVAFEGDVAPDTSGGTYAPLPANVQTSVASGGWVAFVADVLGSPVTTRGLFVVAPDATVRLAFALGETVPAPGTGTISGFDRVFVTPQGIVVALVDLTGGTHTFGLLSARVDGTNTVVEKDSIVYSGDLLPPTSGPGLPGTLVQIDDARMAVTDQGAAFFVATGSNGGVRGVWAATRTGANLTNFVKSGDAAVDVPGGTIGFAFEAIGIDQDGLLLSYAVDVLSGPANAIYVVNTSTLVTVSVAKDGDVAPDTSGLRTFTDAFDGGPLVVALLAGSGTIAWQGEISGPPPNVGVFFRLVTPSVQPVDSFLMPGASAPGTGGFVNGVTLLDPEIDPNRVTVQATVSGGTTTVVFYSIPNADTLTEIFREGTAAPGTAGALFTTQYPSLALQRTNDTDAIGSLAVSAVLSDASSGVWWRIVGCGFFRVAIVGESAPGTGGTFASFATPAVVTAARDNLVFHGFVNVGGPVATGLFRQH